MAGMPVADAVEPDDPVLEFRNLIMQSMAVARRPVSGPVRAGLTLVEILIAMTMTLIVLGVMIGVFSSASQEMARGRAMMDMHNNLRVCSDLLRDDLERVTVDLRPWALESAPNGYFEYVEGPRRDASEIATLENARGDFDDIVAMTVRSDGIPFRGRWIDASGATVTVESNIAEIIWYTDWDDRDADSLVDIEERVTVYRRVLLIRPDLALTIPPDPALPAPPVPPEVRFFLTNDISASFYSGTVFPNSLEDLAKRENRFGHSLAAGYPYLLDRAFLGSTSLRTGNLARLQLPLLLQTAGSDVVANDVTGFDVRVWSPDANVRQANPLMTEAVLIQPGDAGYSINPPPLPPVVSNDTSYAVGYGAFVDLGYGKDLESPAEFPYESEYTSLPAQPPSTRNVLTAPQFSTTPNPNSLLDYPMPVPIPGRQRVYDTFSTHYETNGVDDDQDGLIDEGTDGLDTNPPDPPGPAAGNGVDDVGEREVEPPYPFAVRGIKVTFRTVHRETAQMHQTSVVQSYVRQ